MTSPRKTLAAALKQYFDFSEPVAPVELARRRKAVELAEIGMLLQPTFVDDSDDDNFGGPRPTDVSRGAW
jgi:hypothetical protein